MFSWNRIKGPIVAVVLAAIIVTGIVLIYNQGETVRRETAASEADKLLTAENGGMAINSTAVTPAEEEREAADNTTTEAAPRAAAELPATGPEGLIGHMLVLGLLTFTIILGGQSYVARRLENASL